MPFFEANTGIYCCFEYTASLLALPALEKQSFILGISLLANLTHRSIHPPALLEKINFNVPNQFVQEISYSESLTNADITTSFLTHLRFFLKMYIVSIIQSQYRCRIR